MHLQNMKNSLKIVAFMFISFSGYSQTTFEGTIKWALRIDYTDTALARTINQNMIKMLSPENIQKLKEMESKMKDSAYTSTIDPSLKTQMEQAIMLMNTMEQNPDTSPINALLPKSISLKTKDSNYIFQIEGANSVYYRDILYLKKGNKKYSIQNKEKKYSLLLEQYKSTNTSNSIVTLTKEHEKILNHKCFKYTIETMVKGKKATHFVWATKDIKGVNQNCFFDINFWNDKTDIDFSKIEGVPLKMIIISEVTTVIYTATEVSKKAVEVSLLALPKGYIETAPVLKQY